MNPTVGESQPVKQSHVELASIPGRSVRFVEDTAALSEVFSEELNVAVLRRPLPAVVAEFVAHEHFDRTQLGSSANKSLGPVVRPKHVQQVDVGDVVLLKGEGWLGNEGRGAVHRSPAASSEHPRMVLTLDPFWSS